MTISDTPKQKLLFCGPTVEGIYAWTQAGSRLSLRLVKDRCTERAGVLIGIWKKSA